MHSVLSDKELHLKATRGYKKVGQSVALNGSEDNLIVREAAGYWNQATSDGYKNMREKVNEEMAIVKEHWTEGQITWNEQFVRKLINDYPKAKKVDAIIDRLGDVFFLMTPFTTCGMPRMTKKTSWKVMFAQAMMKPRSRLTVMMLAMRKLTMRVLVVMATMSPRSRLTVWRQTRHPRRFSHCPQRKRRQWNRARSR